jgi:hypothetical protein
VAVMDRLEASYLDEVDEAAAPSGPGPA